MAVSYASLISYKVLRVKKGKSVGVGAGAGCTEYTQYLVVLNVTSLGFRIGQACPGGPVLHKQGTMWCRARGSQWPVRRLRRVWRVRQTGAYSTQYYYAGISIVSVVFGCLLEFQA